MDFCGERSKINLAKSILILPFVIQTTSARHVKFVVVTDYRYTYKIL
jgi:hypothetical protein